MTENIPKSVPEAVREAALQKFRDLPELDYAAYTPSKEGRQQIARDWGLGK